jgi:hypothetical protein
MSARRRHGPVFALVLAVPLALAAGPAGAAASGVLQAGDVPIKVSRAAHSTTVFAFLGVEGDCEIGDQVERKATVVSFAANPKSPTSGTQLNEAVFDFGSSSEASSFYADAVGKDSDRAACGPPVNAAGISLVKGPKGVGDARYTLVSKAQIGGKTQDVTQITFREGDKVATLVFIGWKSSYPSPTAIAKKAATRLGAA